MGRGMKRRVRKASKRGARRWKAPKITINDGLIRAARVRISNGLFTNRPKTKLYPLEVNALTSNTQ
ncbi:hypothetical protein DPMN_029799 [Dreissena polymorpha]|uniref:Uncharacterized protein n=1 Tax=Dreissena polymorpha TaxID=45954 RepID=A0A9D4RHR1_DREPO|nr:hypothetical protein DPMN_029799 [Dreissena polymorpha]